MYVPPALLQAERGARARDGEPGQRGGHPGVLDGGRAARRPPHRGQPQERDPPQGQGQGRRPPHVRRKQVSFEFNLWYTMRFIIQSKIF